MKPKLAAQMLQKHTTGIIETLSGERTLPSHQACLDYVQANYNWKAIAQQIKLVYQSTIET
jgi:hypothetical protein